MSNAISQFQDEIPFEVTMVLTKLMSATTVIKWHLVETIYRDSLTVKTKSGWLLIMFDKRGNETFRQYKPGEYGAWRRRVPGELQA